MKDKIKSTLKNKRNLIVIVVVATVLLAIGAYQFYLFEYKATLQARKILLESVNKIKLHQLHAWLQARKGDAAVLGDSPFFTMAVKRYIDEQNDSELGKDILKRMRTFVELYDYHDMLLIDKNGKKILGVDNRDDTIDSTTLKYCITAVTEKRVVFSDFYYSKVHDTIRFEVFAPLYDSQGEVFGVIIMRVNPEKILFPIVEQWPVPTETAESMLVKKQGDSIRHITRLRTRQNDEYATTIPLTHLDVPAVKAAFGYEGHTEGIDYAGAPVLAFAVNVPGTQWFLLTKISKSEAFAEFNERILFIGLLTVMFLGFAVTGTSYMYRSRQRDLYREMYEQERRYQLTLKEKEQLLREVQAIAKVGGWEFDAQTLEGTWTEETARIHGLEPDDPANVEIGLSFYVNGSRQIIEKAVNDAIKYGKPYDLELEMITAKGEQKWVRSIGHPEMVDGKVVRVRGSFQDITDFKRVQLALLEAQEELAITLNSIGDGVISTDRNGIITGLNHVAARLIGYTKAEATGMQFDEAFRIIDASTREPIESPVDRVLRTGEIIGLSNHTLLLSRNGNEINISDSAAPIKDIDEDIRGVVLVFSDVTQAYEARQRLRESEEKYRLLFENMVTGFALHEIVLDDDGIPIDYRFIEVNPGFENITGLLSKDVIGKNVREVIPDVEQFWIDTYGKVALSGQPCKFENYARAIGKYFDVLAFSPKPGFFATVISDITQRKHAEKALEESERNYREIFNSTKEAISILDAETTKVIDANRAMLEMYGYDDFDELKNTTTDDRSANKDENTVNKKLEYIRKAINEGPQIFEWLARKKSGEAFWVEVSLQKTNIGGEGRILAVSRNITEKKKTLDTLKRSEELARNTLNGLSAHIAIVNQDGTVEAVNKAWINFAVENNAMLSNVTEGSNYLDACTNAKGDERIDALRLAEKIREVLNDQIPSYEMEYPCHSPTENRWFVVRVTKFPEEKKAVIAHENITKRKLAELLLKKEQERLQLAIFAGHLGIFDLNITTGDTKVNSQYATMLGHNPDTFQEYGDRWLADVHPDDVDEMRQKFRAHTAGDKSIYDAEFRIKTYSGEWKWLRSIGAIVEWDKQGKPSRMIGVRQDITSMKKLHNELLQAKEKAEESDRLKTAFLQNMSHEIRTPLNGIIGFSELLKDETLTKEERAEFTKIIQLSGKRLIEIVSNVLDISRIDTGQMNIVNKPFALNSVVYDLYDFFYTQATMKSLRLTHSVELPDEASFIVSDSIKLQQILTNLLNNAIKFTDYGEVNFGYKLQDSEILFSVRDSGIGIAQEHFERIFDRFYQTDLSISRHFEGAGLGLSICKGLVELMGGKIWFESEVGEGTNFYFTIPYVPEKTERKHPDKKISEYLDEKKVALVAEDDETSFILLRTILSDNGFEVIHAKNGMEAVEFCRNRDDIALVLMDIRMPVMDGMEASRRIKSFRPDIPIIGETAYALSNEREEIIKSGCDFYISKPIDLYELMSILTKIFND